jgi:hypothetical protein
MKEIAPENLVPGVRYRIHDNGEDTIGIFVGFNTSHDPVFNQLNISRPDGSRFKLNPTIELSYPSNDYTFFKSAKTIKNQNYLKSILNGIVPGLGKEGKKFAGRRTKRSRHNRRV